MHIEGSNGNVGIGTTTAGRRLTVKSNISATVANFESTSSVSGLVSFSDSNTTSDETVRAGAVGDDLVLQAGGAERMRITSAGKVAITGVSPDAVFTVQNAGADIGKITAVFGADENTNTLTNNTNKETRAGIPHYIEAEQPPALFYSSSSSSENQLTIGGGTSRMNAMTSIRFRTAANTTTATGTEAMRIDSSGNLLVGTVVTNGETSNTKPVRAGIFSTQTGVTSCANNTATTLMTFGSNEGNFLVSARLSGTGSVIHNTTGIIHINNSSTSYTVLAAGSQLVLSMSGLALQATQTAGSTLNVTWNVVRIG